MDGKNLKFGAGEWMKFAALILVVTGGVTAAGVGVTKYFVRMEIKTALDDHSKRPHPLTEQRLNQLENP